MKKKIPKNRKSEGSRLLPSSELFHPCNAADIGAALSSELEPIEGIIGQERAVEAVNFAVSMDTEGHNLFVLGPPGTGRQTFVDRALADAAKNRGTPSDWCYVNNFDDPHCPFVIELPAGDGRAFALRMENFVADARAALLAAFDGEDYQARYRSITSEFQDHQSAAMDAVHKEASERGIRLIQSPSGMIFAPVRDGEVIGPEEYAKLPEKDQQEIQKSVEDISKKLQQAVQDMPQRMRKTRERVASLDNEVTKFAIGGLIEDLKTAYADHPRIKEYLIAVEQDLIDNSTLLRPNPEQQSINPFVAEDAVERRYAVNVIVSRELNGSAPVIIEDHPTYEHLIGRVEQRAQWGTLSTDFTLIRGGSLHRANGGFLVINADRVLREPFAWDALKRALKTSCVKIESIAEAIGATTTVALEPQPIPLNVKVALIGEPNLYYLLHTYDPEFRKLFKIAADFDDRMDRNADSQNGFARIIAALVAKNSLLPVTREGMCRLIEEAARDAGDQEKLSMEIRRTEDLLQESQYCASQRQRSQIDRDDIDQAIAAREFRQGRVQDRVVEEITRGNILIDTEGSVVGQVNALAIHQLGEHSFGRPNRISARVSIGSGKVLDIERESDLGGSLHSKGILILSGYIAANYDLDSPLSLSATIAFEQSYGGIDGDSASSAELYALLSAIANVPINQSYAVTGSVNQFGEVQAIGGVNEKIEGFFDVCAKRGLTGKQGVLIPESNVKHLMLRTRIRNAVAGGEFHIHAIRNIDAGLSVLTGLGVGKKGRSGKYNAKSLNRLIRDGLTNFALQRRNFSQRDAKEGKK